MTNKEAIEILKNIKEWLQDEGLQYDVKALENGIEALENQKTGHWIIWKESICCFNFEIGDYTEEAHRCKCSECEEEIIPEEVTYFTYCPFCGAKMEGE